MFAKFKKYFGQNSSKETKSQPKLQKLLRKLRKQDKQTPTSCYTPVELDCQPKIASPPPVRSVAKMPAGYTIEHPMRTRQPAIITFDALDIPCSLKAQPETALSEPGMTSSVQVMASPHEHLEMAERNESTIPKPLCLELVIGRNHKSLGSYPAARMAQEIERRRRLHDEQLQAEAFARAPTFEEIVAPLPFTAERICVPWLEREDWGDFVVPATPDFCRTRDSRHPSNISGSASLTPSPPLFRVDYDRFPQPDRTPSSVAESVNEFAEHATMTAPEFAESEYDVEETSASERAANMPDELFSADENLNSAFFEHAEDQSYMNEIMEREEFRHGFALAEDATNDESRSEDENNYVLGSEAEGDFMDYINEDVTPSPSARSQNNEPSYDDLVNHITSQYEAFEAMRVERDEAMDIGTRLMNTNTVLVDRLEIMRGERDEAVSMGTQLMAMNARLQEMQQRPIARPDITPHPSAQQKNVSPRYNEMIRAQKDEIKQLGIRLAAATYREGLAQIKLHKLAMGHEETTAMQSTFDDWSTSDPCTEVDGWESSSADELLF